MRLILFNLFEIFVSRLRRINLFEAIVQFLSWENIMTDFYADEKKTGNGLAITGMILGIISIVLCFGPIAGIPAIIVSGIALSKISQGKANGKGMAVTGLITGIIGVFFIFVIGILAGLLLPALSKAHGKAKEISCMNNEKQIGMALIMYAGDFDGKFPPYDGAKGLDLLRQKDYLIDPKVFVCPNSNTIPASFNKPITEDSCDYIYVGGLNEESGNNTPMLLEKPNNHNKYGNILFVDGHVKGYQGANWMKDKVK